MPYRWRLDYSQQGLTELLNEKCSIDAQAILGFSDFKRGGSGRLSRITIHYLDKKQFEHRLKLDREYEIRRVFHKGFLFSSCFYIDYKPEGKQIPETFSLHGAGWGHGVGLCQIGALGMAMNSYTTEQILSHYYPGSQLIQIYE